MSFEVEEGLLIDLGSDREREADSAPLSDVSSARSRVSSILWSSAKRLEDDDDPFGLLTTPSASKKVRKVPECQLGTLVKLSDETSAEISEIPPPNSNRSYLGSFGSGDVFLSDNKSESLLDRTADSTDWQKVRLEAEAIASTMKSAVKPERSGLDKKLDLGQFSPLDDSPLAIKSPPVRTLRFDFEEEFVRKKLSPEILFVDEDSDGESDGIFLDDQLEIAIGKSLDDLEISRENPRKKPVAAVAPSKRKPLVPVVPRNRAHGGIPLPPPKKGQKPVGKEFSTPKAAPKPTVRRSLAPTPGPDTPRPSTFLPPAVPSRRRRSLIPGPGTKLPIYSSTPKAPSTPAKSSNIPTPARSTATPKSFVPTAPTSSAKKPVLKSVPKYSSSSTVTKDDHRPKPSIGPSVRPSIGPRRSSMSFRNPVKY